MAVQQQPQPAADEQPKKEFKQSTANLPKEAINRTFRGDKEGKIKLEVLPDFVMKTDEESLLKKREWVKEHLVVAFRYWGALGFGEGVAGHITVKDPILRDVSDKKTAREGLAKGQMSKVAQNSGNYGGRRVGRRSSST